MMHFELPNKFYSSDKVGITNLQGKIYPPSLPIILMIGCAIHSITFRLRNYPRHSLAIGGREADGWERDKIKSITKRNIRNNVSAMYQPSEVRGWRFDTLRFDTLCSM